MRKHLYFTHSILNTSSDTIFYTDSEDQLFFANPPAIAELGADSMDQLLGLRIQDLEISPELKAILQNSRELASRYGASEDVVRYDAGQALEHLRIRCQRVLGEHQEPLGYAYIYARDVISEDAEYDKIIINNLMKNTSDAIYFKDLNSKFKRCSDSLVDRIGAKSMDDLIGKSDFDFWDSSCAEVFFEDEQEIIRTRQPIAGKAEQECRPDGQKTWVLTSKMPLLDASDNVIGTFGISKDITQQKQIESELERTHQKLVETSRFAGMAEVATNVLHNVGNVLNSINVSVDHTNEISKKLKIDNLKKLSELVSENAHVDGFLTNDEKGKHVASYMGLIADQLARDRREIESELDAMKRHLEHIKNIVSMQQEYATAKSVVDNVDLAQILEDAVRMSSGSLARHNIELERRFEPGTFVVVDKHRVLQILVNLIRNAKHACQDSDVEHKRITISTDTTGEESFKILVQDNGVGISAENMVNLFGHGFTTKKHGHGFGLHSGANAAKEMGGSLSVTSDGLGHGATFTLTLPKKAESENVNCQLPIINNENSCVRIGTEVSVSAP